MGVVLVDENGDPIDAGLTIYPCNLPAVEWFLACATQWRRKLMDNSLLGLDYPGAEAAARLAGITPTPDLFDDLRHIERGALGAVADMPELDGLNITHVEFDEEE